MMRRECPGRTDGWRDAGAGHVKGESGTMKLSTGSALLLLQLMAFTSVSAQQPAPAQPPAGAPPLNPTQEVAGESPQGPALDLGPAKLRIGGYLGLTAIYRST